MTVKQIYELMNTVTGEVLGKTDLVAEDLSNVVDVGTEVFNATAVDNYVKTLVNHIGKVIFVNRPYSGKIPSVLMDSWEFGSVLEKISCDTPAAEENESWDLVDGQEYKQDIFYKPTVSAKFFNSKVTFEVPMSFTEKQVKESFSNAAQLNGFISMIYNAVDRSMTIKIDSLVMRTINSMIAQTLNADKTDFAGGYGTASTPRCVNLLKLYNDEFFPATGSGGTTPNPDALTADKAMLDKDFIRYASYIMGLYVDRLASISTLFNVGGKDRFTDAANLHFITLSDFAKSADVYLQSDVRHNELTKLPNYETVPYWQGSGQAYDFADTSAINVKIDASTTVNITGIIGVMFDRDALGVANLDRRVTTAYNAKAEFFNNYYKFDAGYFNDTNENFVVFFVSDAKTGS